jgi:hypothetical protein
MMDGTTTQSIVNGYNMLKRVVSCHPFQLPGTHIPIILGTKLPQTQSDIATCTDDINYRQMQPISLSRSYLRTYPKREKKRQWQHRGKNTKTRETLQDYLFSFSICAICACILATALAASM